MAEDHYCDGCLLNSKASKLAAIGLGKNPCQGCEAYYTREGLLTGCAVEADGGCEWIKLHDAALAGVADDPPGWFQVKSEDELSAGESYFCWVDDGHNDPVALGEFHGDDFVSEQFSIDFADGGVMFEKLWFKNFDWPKPPNAN
jgi:hypothetical protein